jgi:hypothetical protein
MDCAVRNLITTLHQSTYRYILAITGGGTGAAAWLLSVPGGSRTVLEVAVPYSEQALGEYLGYWPSSFCSVQTSREMARRAQERARWLAPGLPVAGVGCTASLRSDRPKHGDHRLHLTVQTDRGARTHSLTLTKAARDREGEETLLDLVLLNALAEAFGVSERLPVPLLPGEEIQIETHPTSDALAMFLAGHNSKVCVESDGCVRSEAPQPRVLLPGSFNPLHEGHCSLVTVAERLVGAPAAFELSVRNADKPPLAEGEVRRRLAQFTWRGPVWLTHSPTFAEKADLFPDTTFVVGADTASRIVAPRFYGDSEAQMAEALANFRARGCRFLVAGRVDAEGHFCGLDDVAIPSAYRDLFTGIPETLFRLDLSSTELRAAARQ